MTTSTPSISFSTNSLNGATTMNNPNYRPLTITNKNNESILLYINEDGTSIIRPETLDSMGRKLKQRELKVSKNGQQGSRQPRDRFTVIKMDVQVAVAVYSAWHNNGVYVTERMDGLTCDHIDQDYNNHHYSNLCRISRVSNNAKGRAWRRSARIACGEQVPFMVPQGELA